MDRLHAVDQRPLNGLFDPPARVGAEPRAVLRVEALDRLEQADVPLLDEIGELEAAVHVVLGDVDDEAEVRADHPLARLGVVLVDDAARQRLLLVGRQQARLVDLAQVQLEPRLDGG